MSGSAGSEVEVIAKGKVAYLVPVQSFEELQAELAGKLDQKKRPGKEGSHSVSGSSLVLDSSVWIESLNNGDLAKPCLRELKAASRVYVPTLVTFEVYRKVALARSEDQALSATTLLSQYESEAGSFADMRPGG